MLSRTHFPKFPLPENAAAKLGELRTRFISSPALQALLERLRPVIERALTEVGAQLDKHPKVASGLHKAARLARRPSRLALGAAAAAVLTAGIVTSVTVGSAAPAANSAATADAAGHSGPAVTSQAHAAAAPAAPPHSAPPATAAHSATPATAAKPAAPGRADRAHGQAVRTAAGPGQAVRTAGPAKPYQIYDSVTPSGIPTSQHVVATYADGPYSVSPSQVSARDKVLWIDTNGSDPKADVLDVEPTDATPPQAASWAAARLGHDPQGTAIIYTMRSEWPAVQSAVASLPAKVQSHVRYWIADPTGQPHIVPGSSATQWYWGTSYDISTASPGF